jgi:FkbM family methyltransferase
MISLRRKIYLHNPYTLKKNFFIFLYSIYPNLSNKLLKAFFYLPNIIINFIGFYFLVHQKYSYIDVNYKKYPLKFTARDTNSQFHSIYFDQYKNTYEPDVSGILKIFLKQSSTFIDIGSNWGHHSFIAAIEKGCKVIQFEPNPEVFDDLTRIRKELKLEKKVSQFNFGLSNKNQTVNLSQDNFASGSVSMINNYSPNKFIYETVFRALSSIFKLKNVRYKVKCKPLDYFDFQKVSMIKIDAEGFELQVLLGSIKTIQKNRPGIIFEFHATKNNISSFISFFKKITYKLYQIQTTSKGNKFQIKLFEIDTLGNGIYNLYASPTTLKKL